MTQLTVMSIITNTIQIALKNSVSIAMAVALWLLTLWIPYINVGTTIALIGMVVALSKGEVISPFEIFHGRYRQYMGEFFLLLIFLEIGIISGLFFLIIPGIIISIAWGQALYLMLDKGMNPIEALTRSNKITHGKKLTIFLGTFGIYVVSIIAVAILSFLFTSIAEILGMVFNIVAAIFLVSVFISQGAYIYGVLSKEADQLNEHEQTHANNQANVASSVEA